MADGIYYRDTRSPFLIADDTSVAPTTTAKAMWTSKLTALPANYWTPGKIVKLTGMFKLTAGTAGNWTFGMGLGAHDNPGVIVQSKAVAKIASVGPFVCFVEGYAICRSIPTPTTATLSMWGHARASIDIMLSTVQPLPFPNAGVTVVSTFDNTVATNELTFQLTSSAGVDACVCVGLVMEALN